MSVAGCCQLAVAQAETPTVETVVSRMVQAHSRNRAQVRPYVVTRKYEVYQSQKDESKSRITAQVSFLPPNVKTFEIQQSTGGMPERVVRKALEKEVDMARDPQLGELLPENYSFTAVGKEAMDGHDCYVMRMKPKRDSKDLIEGTVWVDAQTFLVRRIEGHPVKSPSWWVKGVELVLSYGEMSGMWMQCRSEATAHVRMAGEYKMISQNVEINATESVAANVAPRKIERPKRRMAVVAAEMR